MKITKQIYRNFTDRITDFFETQLRSSVSNFVTDEENNPIVQLTSDIAGPKYVKHKSNSYTGSIFVPALGIVERTWKVLAANPTNPNEFTFRIEDIEYLSVKRSVHHGLYSRDSGSDTISQTLELLVNGFIIQVISRTDTVGVTSTRIRFTANFDQTFGLDKLISESNTPPFPGLQSVEIRHTIANGGIEDVTVANVYTQFNIEYIMRDGSQVYDRFQITDYTP